jgi:succinate dehydrogenase hydrophobic anchor subunit
MKRKGFVLPFMSLVSFCLSLNSGIFPLDLCHNIDWRQACSNTFFNAHYCLLVASPLVHAWTNMRDIYLRMMK